MNAAEYYASKRTPPTVLLTEDDLALVARLARRFAKHRTPAVINGFYQDAAVQFMLSGRDELARDRAAYMSGLVVAEVALARMARAA